MARLFFLLSGEHPTLPFSELKAILEAEGHAYRVVDQLDQVMRLEVEVDCVPSVVRRAALTRACCAELFVTNADTREILRRSRLASFEKDLRKSETFAVRVRRIGESAPQVDSLKLEREIGAIILKGVQGAQVRLTNPDVTFLGIITGDFFIFGRRLVEVFPRPFVERRPRKRPFFHPSAMPAKLARCMVNLAQVQTEDLVLDPFCGTGGFLVEAGIMGFQTVGFDIQKRMVKGSLKNLHYYAPGADAVLRADALHPPVRTADRVVTDPPYGRCSKTLGRQTSRIVQDFLKTAKNYVPCGKRVCIAFPKGILIDKWAEHSGFKLTETHLVYVHRSLTREIAVLERV